MRYSAGPGPHVQRVRRLRKEREKSHSTHALGVLLNSEQNHKVSLKGILVRGDVSNGMVTAKLGLGPAGFGAFLPSGWTAICLAGVKAKLQHE